MQQFTVSPFLIAGDPERFYEKERKAKGITID